MLQTKPRKNDVLKAIFLDVYGKVRPWVPLDYLMLPSVFVLSAASFFCSYELRFDFLVPQGASTQRTLLIPYVSVLKTVLFYLMAGRIVNWRYTGLADLPYLVIQAVASSIVLYILRYLDVHLHIPRGVVLIDCCLYLLIILGFLGAFRLLREKTRRIIGNFLSNPRSSTVMIGAGDAGEMLLRETRRNPNAAYDIKAVFDDDSRKVGHRIRGVPVNGTVEDIPDFVRRKGIRTCIIAVPSITAKRMSRIHEILRPLGIEVRILPSFSELLNRPGLLKQLRPINIGDLLGRAEVQINIEGLSRLIKGKRVVVTGAGGSIGSELCRQIWNRNPSDLTLLDFSENNLFHIHRKLLETTGSERNSEIHPVLMDIRDYTKVGPLFHKHRPDLVFHAAAHKHVPMQEINPQECFQNNVGGIKTMVRISHETNVERFLLISTDKAVNPVSVMGATKRACELYCQSYAAISPTKFMAVRFGNVLGSEGSVVPIFLEQIARGGPVTITHQEVARYFMSIPEAVTLVLQATAIGKSGQVMMLDMGDPVRIMDLAKQLVFLSGKSEQDIEFEITGLRPGEKLFEELQCDWEACLPTDHEKVRVLRQSVEDAEAVIKKIDGWVAAAFQSNNCFDPRAVLRDIVPEYKPFSVV